MPCCAGKCPVMKAAPHQDDASAILTTTVATPTPAQVALVAAVAPSAAGSIEIAAIHQESPPPFLLHEQFRI